MFQSEEENNKKTLFYNTNNVITWKKKPVAMNVYLATVFSIWIAILYRFEFCCTMMCL